jgi:phosphate transport system permease protein
MSTNGIPSRSSDSLEPVSQVRSDSHVRRRTLPSAIGEPMVWLTGGALVTCLTMIVMLITMVVINGSITFWPRPIEQLTLDNQEVVLGIATDHDTDPETGLNRTLYQVGNRDIGQESFRWINDDQIVESITPDNVVMLEREAWGVWFGVPESIIRVKPAGAISSPENEDIAEVEVAEDSVETVSSGSEQVMADFRALSKNARVTKAEIEKLKKSKLGSINSKIERLRIEVSQAEIDSNREDAQLVRFTWIIWAFMGTVFLGLLGGVYKFREFGTELGSKDARKGKLIRMSMGLVAVMLVLSMWVGAPWKGQVLNESELEALRLSVDEQETQLLQQYDLVLTDIRAIEEQDKELRIVVTEPTTGRFAPTSQTLADEHLHVSQIVRFVPANTLSTAGKVGVFFSRWWEYLSTYPREANTEGGVYPVIVGTVLLTLLLTIVVTPMGVIAALYLREYAKQGLVTSLIRIAVNNLAGVPSIVYGVFGLGFFCYTVGQYVDTGPSEHARMNAPAWWGMFVLSGVVLMLAYSAKLWSKPEPGKAATSFNRMMQRFTWVAGFALLVMVVLLVTRTPYYNGMFEARAEDGTPTFGARGLLWASLTLALLTLPVVIVATEEAIAAVPNSMRQGSYGCGASKWQTIRRIVLPGALPGILTGAILAMARGAGEVAPLMLVGAVKLNQDLPFSSTAPYLHADRSFMHLGFHIYDLGFQSPDSQAARPLVWTTTLLFLTIVFALNLAAIMIRSRLKARMSGPTV